MMYQNRFSNYSLPEQGHDPFGMLAVGRNWEVGSEYRYGFNGKESDSETYGEGNVYDYGFRIYNPRLGRFLTIDPLTRAFPWYTPYQFAGNKPIACVDLDGLEDVYYNDEKVMNGNYTDLPVLDVLSSTEIGSQYLEQFQNPEVNSTTNYAVVEDPNAFQGYEKTYTLTSVQAKYLYGIKNDPEALREWANKYMSPNGDLPATDGDVAWVTSVANSQALEKTIEVSKIFIVAQIGSETDDGTNTDDPTYKKDEATGLTESNLEIKTWRVGHSFISHAAYCAIGEFCSETQDGEHAHYQANDKSDPTPRVGIISGGDESINTYAPKSDNAKVVNQVRAQIIKRNGN